MSGSSRKLSRRSKGSLAWRGLERVVEQHGLPRALREDQIVESPCGHCGELLDGATHGEGCKPKPGDYAVCWACANVNRFDHELRLVKVTDAELEEADRSSVDVDVLEEMRAIFRRAYLAPLAKRAPKGDA